MSGFCHEFLLCLQNSIVFTSKSPYSSQNFDDVYIQIFLKKNIFLRKKLNFFYSRLEFFIDFYIIFDYFFYEVRKSYGGFMETLEITSLSTKGQVVIPRNIRNQLNLDTGDKLIVVCDGSNILLKPILSPNLSEFKALVEETDKITNELATTPEKLSDFIKDNR